MFTHRQAFRVAVAASLLALMPACAGQGGYGFGGGGSNASIDRIVLTNGSGQANVFLVVPPPPLGGGVPPNNAIFLNRDGSQALPQPVVQINAAGVRGSQSVIVPDAQFTWTASLVTSDLAVYNSNQGGLQKPCFPATSPTGDSQLPDVSPFSATPVLWVELPGPIFRPLNPQQLTSTIYVSPALENLVGFEPGHTNYCIAVTAVGSGATATTNVAVSSSP
jgi:hypothetical protein